MPATPTVDPAAIAQLEAQLAESAQDFAQEAPEQYEKLQRVLKELKRGGQSTEEVKALAVELFRWQIGLQRREYQKELDEARRAFEATGALAAGKAAEALEHVVGMLEKAERVELPPDPAVLRDVEASVERARRALEDATAAMASSTGGLVMKPVNGPIVSASGVPLRAVEPRVAATVGSEKKPVAAPKPAAALKPAGGWATTAQLAQLAAGPAVGPAARPASPKEPKSGTVRDLGVSGPAKGRGKGS